MKKIGKLVLNRETIRELTGDELKDVAGGVEKCHNTGDPGGGGGGGGGATGGGGGGTGGCTQLCTQTCDPSTCGPTCP